MESTIEQIHELKTNTRKEQLRSMSYMELQSTKEYKKYLNEMIYSKSKLVNSEIDYILNSEGQGKPFEWDDVENNYSDFCTECNEDIEQTEFTDGSLGCPTCKRGDCIEQQPKEIYQWFLMDERIISQLEELKEPTLDGAYWGRTSFGQAIEMDSVIIQLFKEWYLEIYGVLNNEC